MELENLLYIIDDPNRIAENDVDMLEDVLGDYPYFQLAHVLLAKGTHNKKNVLTSQKIRKAAAYTYSRSILRRLIENQIESIDVNDYVAKFEKDKEDRENLIQEDILNNQEEYDKSSQNETFSETATVSNTVDFINAEPSEALAMRYFNAGSITESIRVYEQLMNLHPENSDYYEGQIGILKGEQVTQIIPPVEENTSLADTQNLEIDNQTEVVSYAEEDKTDDIVEVNIPENQNSTPELEDDFHVSETLALGYYNKGQLAEAVGVYKKLLLKYPEREYYYNNQINVLQEELGNQRVSQSTENIFPEDTGNVIPTQTYQDVEATKEVQSIPYEDPILEKDDLFPEDVIPTQTYQEVEATKEVQSIPYEDPILEKDDLFPEDVVPLDLGIQKEEESQPVEDTEASFFDTVLEEDTNNTIAEISTFEQEAMAELNERRNAFVEKKEEGSFFDHLDEPIEEKQNIISTSTSEINEDAAMAFFNAGDSEKALGIYKKLILQHPEKEEYYLNQINILTGSIENLNQKFTSESNVTKEVDSWVENNFSESSSISEEKNTNFASENDDLNEGVAMGLFNEGKVEAAVAVYHQLIQKFPERKDYFLMQIEVLTS